MHVQEVVQEVVAPQEVKVPYFCSLPARTNARSQNSLPQAAAKITTSLRKAQEVVNYFIIVIRKSLW